MLTEKLTEFQTTQFDNMLKAVSFDELCIMSVLYDNKPRACVCISYQEENTDWVIIPIAVILENEDMDVLVDSDGEVPNAFEEN